MQDKLNEDLKMAMRKGDVLRRSVIRLVRAEIKNQEIKTQSSLDDTAVLKILTRLSQQRRESIEAFAKGNRHDLVEKEKEELEIILEYLPDQMPLGEIQDVVLKIINDLGAKDTGDVGKVMKQVMPRVQGKAEGRIVREVALKLLSEAETS